jgi:hypothetical protein
MPNENQRLTYEELVALLKRSTALQHRRGTADFSKDDLLGAAKELGIDPIVASEVVDAHLARRLGVELVPRPFNSRIELVASPAGFALTIPPIRFTPQGLAPIGFTAIWFAFIAFWTKGALRGGGPFAAFSIPFWVAGISILWRSVMPLLQTTRVTFDRETGSIRKSPLGRTRSLRTAEVVARIGEHVRYRHDGTGGERRPGKALLLEHGTDTFALLDGYSEQEQRWIESELRAWLLNR